MVNQGSNDAVDIIRALVPSFNATTQPISDAATLVRPVNLRGLPPDNTLVLVNGKRQHRAAVIAFLGGGISDGSQGADISTMPAIALKQVEVLRDGASSQYGSDAIAGVINFILEGRCMPVERWKANGAKPMRAMVTSYQIAANTGLRDRREWLPQPVRRIPDRPTPPAAPSQRDDAAALIAAGNTAGGNSGADRWRADQGRYPFYAIRLGPEREPSTSTRSATTPSARLRAGFYFRNPTNRAGRVRGTRR